MKQFSRIVVGLLAASPCLADFQTNFTRLVQTGDPIPGSSETFTNISRASTSASGNFAWWGAGQTVGGIYKQVGGVQSVVAQSGMAIPDGVGNWSAGSFTNSLGKIDGNDVAFRAGNGLYASFGGAAPVRIADTTMINPGTGMNFPSFQQPYISNGEIGFAAGSTGSAASVLLYSGGVLNPVWGVGTTLPSPMTGEMWLMGQGVYNNGHMAQQVFDADSRQGILTNRSGSLEMAASGYQNVPGQAFTFTQFLDPSIDGDSLAFIAWGQPGTGPGGTGFFKGVYREDGAGTGLEAIADITMAAPGSGTTFKDFARGPSIMGDTVFFGGGFSGTNALEGLYVHFNGQLERIIDVTQTLDGKTPVSFDIIGESLYATNKATFLANFSDGSKGVYLVEFVPEPTSAMLIGLGAAALWARRRGC